MVRCCHAPCVRRCERERDAAHRIAEQHPESGIVYAGDTSVRPMIATSANTVTENEETNIARVPRP